MSGTTFTMLTSEDQVPEGSLGRIGLSAEYEDIFKHLCSSVLFCAH